jgi:hypothetical protein
MPSSPKSFTGMPSVAAAARQRRCGAGRGKQVSRGCDSTQLGSIGGRFEGKGCSGERRRRSSGVAAAASRNPAKLEGMRGNKRRGKLLRGLGDVLEWSSDRGSERRAISVTTTTMCGRARGGRNSACMCEGRGWWPFIGGFTHRFEGKARRQGDPAVAARASLAPWGGAEGLSASTRGCDTQREHSFQGQWLGRRAARRAGWPRDARASWGGPDTEAAWVPRGSARGRALERGSVARCDVTCFCFI